MTALCHSRVRAALLLALLLPAWRAHATEPGIEVTANRTQIYLGESVVLTSRISGDGIGTPDLGGLKGCAVKSLGSQDISRYSITIVNGQMHREGFSGRMFVYEVTPAQAGDFACGPIQAQAGGKALTGKGPTVGVQGVEKQPCWSTSRSTSCSRC